MFPTLYTYVLVPPAVRSETQLEPALAGAELLPWLRVAAPSSQALVTEIRAASRRLGAGEVEAIALAGELGKRLLIDESLGRAVAESRGIEVTGLLGVLLAAKATGILAAVAPIVDALERDGFRMTPDLKRRILRLAEEV